LTLLPILDQNHKGLVLKIAKVPLQISFKTADHNEKTLFVLFSNETAATLGGYFREITQPFRKMKTEINDLR